MSPEQALSREAALQRAHWARTAVTYDAEHSPRDEHGRAAAWLAGAMVFHDWTSLLEVGAGTGRILEEAEGIARGDLVASCWAGRAECQIAAHLGMGTTVSGERGFPRSSIEC